MEVLSTYFKEEGGFRARAEVVRDNDMFKMVIYDQNGEYVTEKSFPGKSVYFAESAAINWTLGMQVINE